MATVSPQDKFSEVQSFFKRMSDEMCLVVESYYIWRTLTFCRSIPEVGQEVADKNAKLMSLYTDFFVATEHSHLKTFVIGIMKFFDKDRRALSIPNIIKELESHTSIFTASFIKMTKPELIPFGRIKNSYKPVYKYTIREINKIQKKHLKLINELKDIRDKQFAHTDIQTINGTFIPLEVETLIKDIQEMLNKLSNNFDFSATIWDHLKDDAVRSTEFLMENLERGENKRKEEIKAKYGY